MADAVSRVPNSSSVAAMLGNLISRSQSDLMQAITSSDCTGDSISVGSVEYKNSSWSFGDGHDDGTNKIHSDQTLPNNEKFKVSSMNDSSLKVTKSDYISNSGLAAHSTSNLKKWYV